MSILTILAFAEFFPPSAPLHPVPAADPLAVEFALDVGCDPQLSAVPEAVHLTGEVFGELR